MWLGYSTYEWQSKRSIMLSFGVKKIPIPQLDIRGTHQKWMFPAPSPRSTFIACFFLEENETGNVYLQMLRNWLTNELIANGHEGRGSTSQQDGDPHHNRMGHHLTGSILCGFISMTICEVNGSDVLVKKIMCCWNGRHVHQIWHSALFSFPEATWGAWFISLYFLQT